MAQHIAVMSTKAAVEAVFNGQKTVEARLTQDRIPPFDTVKHNDEILIKPAGGLIYGQVQVDNVLFYENLTGEKIGKLRKEYNGDTQTDDEYWSKHANARYATIIFLKNPRRYLAPIKLEKRDRRPWVVLG